jgi:hypothetical protein
MLFLAGIAALLSPRTAAGQPGRAEASAPRGWSHLYKPSINYKGITPADRAFAMARLAEIEQVFYRIPLLANPTEFVVRKQFFGGTRPLWVPNGTARYNLFIWFFGDFLPSREIVGEGCTCIEISVNAEPVPLQYDEHGIPIFIEKDPGDAIPGATAVYRGHPTDEREVHVSVTFTRGGEFPFEPLSREEYLRARIIDIEGKQGEKVAGFRKALEKTAYEQWMEGAAQRKQDREALAARLKGIRTPDEIARQIAAMEANEREVTEQLRAQDAEERKRNRETLAKPIFGDRFRAQLEGMSPEERRQPAMVQKDAELLPPGAPGGSRVLRPKPEFWRVRRSPVEVHSITVSIAGATGMEQTRDAVIAAIQQAFRNLDWAALKRMVP